MKCIDRELALVLVMLMYLFVLAGTCESRASAGTDYGPELVRELRGIRQALETIARKDCSR